MRGPDGVVCGMSSVDFGVPGRLAKLPRPIEARTSWPALASAARMDGASGQRSSISNARARSTTRASSGVAPAQTVPSGGAGRDIARSKVSLTVSAS